MVFRLVQERLDARLHEAPGSRVEGLLLRPDDRLCVGVGVEVLAQQLPGEGVELLDARDGGAVLVQGGVDLAGAEDDAGDLRGGQDGGVGVRRVGDYPFEGGVPGEVGDVGAGERVPEEGFGEEEDERCFWRS